LCLRIPPKQVGGAHRERNEGQGLDVRQITSLLSVRQAWLHELKAWSFRTVILADFRSMVLC
jgi:hypothetical protein